MLDNQNSDSYTFGCPPGGKIMQGPLRGFHQDLHSTFSYGPLKHLGQDLHILGTAPSNSCKIVIEGPDQISLPGSHRIKNQHRATARVVCHAQSAERVALVISKFAPHHSESNLTRTKCRGPRGLCERYQNWHRATRRAICHVQSAETVAPARSKFAPRHNESNLTGTECREGCASNINIGTVPQGERSATRKVPKRLRERDPNSHRATTRAIRHAQSHESLARAQNRFLQNIARTTKNEH